MADSKSQRAAEIWIRDTWLPQQFGQGFVKRKLDLKPGGRFEFDGVSRDNRIAVAISTCGGITAGGKKASPKMHKIRSDALFLLLADLDRRVVVFSEREMHTLCQTEIMAGRFPREVEVMLSQLPADLEAALVTGRRVAAEEVSPLRGAHV